MKFCTPHIKKILVTKLLNSLVNLVIKHCWVIKNVWLEFIARRNICELYDFALRRNICFLIIFYPQQEIYIEDIWIQ